MPASNEDRSKIRKYSESAAALTKQGRGVEASAGTLKDTVMQAVRDDRASAGVSRLATNVGTTMGQLVSAPQGIRDRTRGIVDPLQVNKLTSESRAQSLQTLGEISTHRADTEGTIQESIQAGANQLKARASELYAQAEQDTAEAKSLEDEYQRGFQERKFAADEAYRYRDTGSDRGFELLQGFLGGEPTTPQPQMSAEAGTVVGEWRATGQDAQGLTQWEPAGGQNDLASVFTDPNKVAALMLGDPDNSSKYLDLAQMFEPEEGTASEQERAQVIGVIKGKAQVVLDVIANKDGYPNDEAFEDALKYAVSDYNKRGFDEGGKALTPTEFAIIAGTEIRTTIGKQADIIQKARGITPKSASDLSISDDESSIVNKMNAAIQGADQITSSPIKAGTKTPGSWSPY